MGETKNKNFFIKTKEKISEHRTEIIVISSVAFAVITSLVLIENLHMVKGAKRQLPIKKSSPKMIPASISDIHTLEIAEETRHVFPVNTFVRKLPVGYKASDSQKTKAETLGIILGQNETLVNAHMRSRVA